MPCIEGEDLSANSKMQKKRVHFFCNRYAVITKEIGHKFEDLVAKIVEDEPML